MHKWSKFKSFKITIIWNHVPIYDCLSQVASRSNGALLCPSMCASWADIKINKTVSDFYIYKVKYTDFIAVLNIISFLVFYFRIANLCLFQFRGELKSLDVSWKCFLDPYFWGWSLWFLYNGIYPGRARNNHEAHRRIGYYSYQCQNRLEVRFQTPPFIYI